MFCYTIAAMISKDIDGNEYEITATDLTWRPSAYGIVIHEDKILLVKENDKFHLPGGGIELGEDPKEAVVRELQEESGIVVRNPKLIDANSSFFTWKTLGKVQSFSHVHSLLLYYSCDFSGGNLGDTKLDKYEAAAGLTAEWVEISRLSDIIVGTTVDWRPIVQHVVKSSESIRQAN
jgi:ADP-ribose pyrophosphatase YjhB (NUDIX family)